MSIPTRADLVADVSGAEDALHEARRVLAQFDVIRKVPVGTLRQHPKGTLYALWTGARWFVFSVGAVSGPNIYEANDVSATWDGLTIEEWSLFRA